MKTQTTETGGKHYATVSQGDRIVYRTPGYLTARMALADAQCWEAFHGGKHMPTYTLSLTPMAEGLHSSLKGEHATKEEAWAAVQRTFFNEAVTVYKDGKAVGSFQWMRAGHVEHRDAPGSLVSLRNLSKWGGVRHGWVPTGVQSVGDDKRIGKGPYRRYLQTVKL
ncbi:hypothetical protein ACIP6P_00665 [Streptomyces sp. NPDC088729]|uniref:hypothetical protein n=1 Tax=Streptomyces sp. NPDC088729 TaxID=3365876 RepID=UPI003829ED33